jgi:hypothetical protein
MIISTSMTQAQKGIWCTVGNPGVNSVEVEATVSTTFGIVTTKFLRERQSKTTGHLLNKIFLKNSKDWKYHECSLRNGNPRTGNITNVLSGNQIPGHEISRMFCPEFKSQDTIYHECYLRNSNSSIRYITNVLSRMEIPGEEISRMFSTEFKSQDRIYHECSLRNADSRRGNITNILYGIQIPGQDVSRMFSPECKFQDKKYRERSLRNSNPRI